MSLASNRMKLSALILVGVVLVGAGFFTSCRETERQTNTITVLAGLHSFSFSVNSIDLSRVTITLQWLAISSSPAGERPSIVYFIPGMERDFFGTSFYFPFAWFNSSAWKLLETNNKTYWKWQVVNTLVNLPWSQKPANLSFLPIIIYPFEIFVLDIYMGSSQSVALSSPPPFVSYAGPREMIIEDRPSARLQNPYLSVKSQMDSLRLETLPIDFVSRLKQQGLAPSYFYHVRIEISHRSEVKLLACLGLLVLGVQFAVLVRSIQIRGSISNSNFLQICLGFLLFLPIFLFTFRTGIAPPWVTNLDLLGLLSMLLWAAALVNRLWKYSGMTTTCDS